MKLNFLGLLACATCFSEPILFFNGKIAPSFSSPTYFDQLLVEQGKVIRVGNQIPVPPNVQRLDLKGKWVFPALTDAHMHLFLTGKEKKQLNLREKSLPEIRKMIQLALKRKPQLVVGFGWDQNLWPDKKFPEISFLDSLSKKVPIILFRIDGHAAWTNTIGLRQSDLLNSPEIKGVPKGIVIDLGLEKLQRLIPESSDTEMKAEIKSVVQEGLRHGVTSIHDAGVTKREFDILKATIEKEDLPFRFYEMASSSSAEELDSFLKAGPRENLLDSRLNLRTVKIYLDGALGSRGALFREPYEDAPETKGIQIWKENELEDLVRKVDAHGFQVAIHAIGSRANEIAVSLFEKLWGKKTLEKRPRIEHAQILTKDLIQKMGSLGIVASMQPVHCLSDSPWVVQRIGKERARFSYPWHSLIKAGVPLAFGTDSPIEAFTPWPGLFSSVTRRFFPEEGISISEAFTAFTQGAAYSAFQENSLGTLDPGKWADFIVVEKNLLEIPAGEILKQNVLATYFAGKEVYRKP
ncbi:MAG: amidohydrolase [Proteobacteria bacterium]|nr:amidohydrolase [Pseudomonadota bacterium]